MICSGLNPMRWGWGDTLYGIRDVGVNKRAGYGT